MVGLPLQIPLSLMLELPPSEDESVEYKYSLPVGRIRKTVEGIWAAVEAMPDYLPGGPPQVMCTQTDKLNHLF